MRRARFSEGQIVGIVKQHEAGMKMVDLCREHNISGAKSYAWKAKYGGLEVSEAQELKRLREENGGESHDRAVSDQRAPGLQAGPGLVEAAGRIGRSHQTMIIFGNGYANWRGNVSDLGIFG